MTPWHPGHRGVTNPRCLGCLGDENLLCPGHWGVENQNTGESFFDCSRFFLNFKPTCLHLGHRGNANPSVRDRVAGSRVSLACPGCRKVRNRRCLGDQELGVVFWLLTGFLNFNKAIARSFEAAINKKNRMNVIVTIQILLGSYFKHFPNLIFSDHLPSVPDAEESFSHKTWITSWHCYRIPNGFRKCLIGPGGAVWWRKVLQTNLVLQSL